MTSSTGKLSFEITEGWGTLPQGIELGQVPGIAVDARDRVYVLNRGTPPLIVLDRDGEVIASLGEDILEDPHGICVAPDNRIFVADRDAHVVVRLSPEGKLQLTLGTRGRPVPEHSGTPFNRPTGVALSSEGDIYISDGYGNSRVHKYAPDGSLLLSWGGEGIHPGQFNLPHGICVDRQDRVYIADRENNRVQAFNEEGDYIKEWRDLMRPTDVTVDAAGHIYVSELEGRVSVLSYDGDVLARWGGPKSPEAGQFIAPHGICVDSRGDVYVAEVNIGKRFQKVLRKS